MAQVTVECALAPPMNGDYKQGCDPGVPMALFCAAVCSLRLVYPFLRRITALMRGVIAGARVNPADQRWGFWPLLPMSCATEPSAH